VLLIALHKIIAYYCLRHSTLELRAMFYRGPHLNCETEQKSHRNLIEKYNLKTILPNNNQNRKIDGKKRKEINTEIEYIR